MQLSAQGATKAFRDGRGRRIVLDGVSHVFVSGQSTAVVGPSGSGKSTLLAILGLLLAPDEGTVALDGRRVSPRDADVRGQVMAWVLQTANVLAHRRVLDNVAVGPLTMGSSRREAERRAHAALSVVGLGERAHTVAGLLSGGERQRTCVARAIAQGNPVVLADEPTAQLDGENARLVIDGLTDGLADRIVVVATHDPAVAARADRVLRLSEGKLCPGD